MTKAGSITLAFITTLLITSTAAAFPGDIRYNGVTFSSMAVDTAKISRSLPDSYGEISDHIILIGIEGVAGELNGWAVGGFGHKGELTSGAGTSKAEFTVALAGVTVEKLLLQQSNRAFIAGVRLGGGRYSLRLVQTPMRAIFPALPMQPL
jgi:hypothetical protein